MTIDLYGHPWSAPTREVRIACAELGIEHRFIEVKQAEAGDYLPEALNAACKVPMIDADGFILGEAHAIVRYLAATHGGDAWYPVAPQARARVDQWLDWQALRLGRLAAQLARERRFKPGGPDEAACAEAERLLGLILPELDMELKAAPFIGSEQPTLADIAVYTSVEYLRIAGFGLASFPAIARWADTCTARPGWEPVDLLAGVATAARAR
jgi:glutathione S-transferase